MESNMIEKVYQMLDTIPVTPENADLIDEIRKDVSQENLTAALEKINRLSSLRNQNENEQMIREIKEEKSEPKGKYPKKLQNPKLERTYIGLLLNNPQYIVKFYFLHDQCFFEDDELLNIYKSVLYTEGGAYTPEIAKDGFNFAKDTEKSYNLKYELKKEVQQEKINAEKVYTELKKLFILRKSYTETPIKEIQEKVVEIIDYKLYDQMSVEEIESAVIQVTDTEKFKRAILNTDLTNFLEAGDNNLRNGLSLPFPIMTKVFKGIRKGETMALAMPSNCGKSRLTIDIAAHIALVHKKKVLIISNEMSEEKMRLCFITTIINNKAIQELHGQKDLRKTEGELLEFKFRADNPNETKVDEDGFIVRMPNEKQSEFVKRLLKESTEFKKVIAVTDWANKETRNSIYFINITDHTNDELKKVIMNYYYKEQIEYVFYDTLKADIANIGNGEEVKKTATILSNLAQNFDMYICSTLQLLESNTLPVNLNVNDLSASRTVKEVLDTLSLIKPINRDTLQNYEYSLEEVDTKFYDLKKEKDPDIRYYACVIDKNRAGAKPTLVFKLNLAYNVWEELGYLRLKQNNN